MMLDRKATTSTNPRSAACLDLELVDIAFAYIGPVRAVEVRGRIALYFAVLPGQDPFLLLRVTAGLVNGTGQTIKLQFAKRSALL